MSPTRRTLREMRGFVFDLDGCVWSGDVLTPGAAQVLALIREQGKAMCFLTNNSRARARTMQAKLVRLGVEAKEAEADHWGPSRVLAIGGPELAEVLVEAGHEVVPLARSRDATVVVVGNDFDFSYERLTAASRAVAGGAAFLTPNIDPRLPMENGEFLPGCGAIVEAVAVAAGVRPIVVGKPEPPLFRMALEQMAVSPATAAMVGDSIPSDIRGARAVGMLTVLYAPAGRADAPAGRADAPAGEADLVVGSFAELSSLAGVG